MRHGEFSREVRGRVLSDEDNALGRAGDYGMRFTGQQGLQGEIEGIWKGVATPHHWRRSRRRRATIM